MYGVTLSPIAPIPLIQEYHQLSIPMGGLTVILREYSPPKHCASKETSKEYPHHELSLLLFNFFLDYDCRGGGEAGEMSTPLPVGLVALFPPLRKSCDTVWALC